MLSGESLGKKKLEFENNVNRPISCIPLNKDANSGVGRQNGDLQVYEILFCPLLPQTNFIVRAN